MSDNEDDDASLSNLEGEFDQQTSIWECDALNVVVETDNAGKTATGGTCNVCLLSLSPQHWWSHFLQDCECNKSPGTCHETPRKQCGSLQG